MRALVTNDDGVHSPGLRSLAAAAAAKGLEVTVVAPSYDASGSSASMTAVSQDGRVTAETVAGSAEPAGATRIMGVPGPPAFIVRAAVFGAFGPPPDLILSGVNRGLNTGQAVLHSGTVGAALTASTFGRSALAVSAEVDDGDDFWSPDPPILAAALDWLIDAPGGTVLNVNVPSPGRGGRGVRSTCLAESGTVQGHVTESGGDYVPVTFADAGPAVEGTDAAALAAGFISVTAIRGVTEDDRFDIRSLIRRGAATR